MKISRIEKLRIGIVGTGYAANRRAEYFIEDNRSTLISVAYSGIGKADNSDFDELDKFAQKYKCELRDNWESIVSREDIDLIVICSANHNHDAIALQALENNKHVIIEYPLCLDVKQAEKIINLAKSKNKFLHVEHIELLGSLHQTVKQYLPQIGNVFYTRYNTLKPENPAPQKWTYHHDFFGFPFMAALSRFHRLIDLFGKVKKVSSEQRYFSESASTKDGYYQTCLCSAKLYFENKYFENKCLENKCLENKSLENGTLAELVYGKGEKIWYQERKFELHGTEGGLIFDGDKGFLVNSQGSKQIELLPRKGLFAQDSKIVLDHLFDDKSLYINPEESLYTLKVADAARRSAETGKSILID